MNCRQSDLQTVARATEQPQRRGDLVSVQMLRRRLDLEAAELEPELRRLVHGLEEQLVGMGLLLGRLLEREQVVRPQVPLVVRRTLPGQDRLGEILVRLGCHGVFGSILPLQ